MSNSPRYDYLLEVQVITPAGLNKVAFILKDEKEFNAVVKQVESRKDRIIYRNGDDELCRLNADAPGIIQVRPIKEKLPETIIKPATAMEERLLNTGLIPGGRN